MESLIFFAVALEKCGPESPKTTVTADRARIDVFFAPFGMPDFARFAEDFSAGTVNRD